MTVATKRRQTYVRAKAVITSVETLERYQDTATVIAVGLTSAIATQASKDQAVIYSIGVISAVDGYDKSETGTAQGKGIASATVTHATLDVATATGVAVISSTEDRSRFDTSTITGVGTLSATTQLFAAIDTGTVTGRGIAIAVRQYDDTATVISRAYTTEINIESYNAVDQGTITGVGSAPASKDIRGGVDETTATGTGVVSASQLFAGVDSGTAVGVGSTGNTYYDGWVLDVNGVTLIPDLTNRAIGVGVTSGFENFVWNETATITGIGVIEADVVYQKSIEVSTITGVGVLITDEIQIGSSTNILEGVGIVANQTGGTPWSATVDERFEANRTASPTRGYDVTSADYALFTETGSASKGFGVFGAKIKSIANAIDGYVNSGVITAITNASPPVVTAANHGFAVNQRILIRNVLGATGANGLWKISVIAGNDFTLNTEAGGSPAAPGVWTSGGIAYNGFYPLLVITAATNATPIQVTAAAHSLVTGDAVTVVNGLGNTGVNGTWTVTFVDGNNVTLNGSVGNGVYTASSANMAKMSGTPYAASTSDYTGLPLAQKYNAG